MKKRAFVLILALIMVLSVASTAFAARKGYTPEQFKAALKDGTLYGYRVDVFRLAMSDKKGNEEFITLRPGDLIVAEKEASDSDVYTKVSIYSMGYDQNDEPAWYAMRTGYVRTAGLLPY